MKVNILSGDEMAKYTQTLGISGTTIPFSEAMVTGDVTEQIFGDEFIRTRVKALGTTEKQYRLLSKSMSRIQPSDEIHLWFGEDMFCILNLITSLAYLDNKGVGEVTVHAVFEDDMTEKHSYVISCKGFADVYKSVLLEHLPAITSSEPINKALDLYNDYLSDSGTLAEFIRQNSGRTILSVTVDIIKKYPEYGLSDVQCKELITRVLGLPAQEAK